MFLISCGAGSGEEQETFAGDVVFDDLSEEGTEDFQESDMQEAIQQEQTETPVAAAPPVRVNPPCNTLAFGDGLGGDLWLPVSRGDGLPVYLLNGAWQVPARAEAQLITGAFEQGNFTGFNNPDPDGLRQHFRFSRSCEQYTGLVIVTDPNQSCEVQIPGVCSRID